MPLGRLAITLPVPFHDARQCVDVARRALGLAGEVGEGRILNLLPATALPRIPEACRRGATRAVAEAFAPSRHAA